jgi:hypothetical protein
MTQLARRDKGGVLASSATLATFFFIFSFDADGDANDASPNFLAQNEPVS